MIGPWTHWIAMLATLTVIGCEGGPTSIDQFQAELLAATCARAVRCGSVESIEVCNENFSSGSLSPSLRAAITLGTVDYDGIAANNCIKNFEGGSCDPTSHAFRLPDPACGSVFRGQLHTGADCLLNAQCRSGDCDFPEECEEACCVGRCATEQEIAVVGRSCATVPCSSDTLCDDDQVCAPLLSQGEPCQADAECWFGLVCGISGDPQARCIANPVVSESCVNATRCPTSGLLCDSRTGTCERALFGGEACDPQSNLCSPSYLHCPGDGKCAAYPGPGEPCVSFRCASGSYCDFFGPDEDLCQPARAVGDSCGIAFECATDLCEQGVCVEPTQCVVAD